MRYVHFNYFVLGSITVRSKHEDIAVVGHIFIAGFKGVGDLHPLQMCVRLRGLIDRWKSGNP